MKRPTRRAQFPAKAALLMFLALIVIAMPSCQKQPAEDTQGAEKIQNGDFEESTKGWTGGDAKLSIAEGGNSGKCLELTRVGGNGPYAIQLDALHLDPNARYQFVFYVKAGSSGNDAFRAGIWDNHAINWVAVKTGKATAEWTRYEIPFTTTGKNMLSPELIKDSSKDGSMLFDSVALQRLN